MRSCSANIHPQQATTFIVQPSGHSLTESFFSTPSVCRYCDLLDILLRFRGVQMVRNVMCLMVQRPAAFQYWQRAARADFSHSTHPSTGIRMQDEN